MSLLRIVPRFALALTSALLAAACDTGPGKASVELSFSHLLPIEKRYGHYEAWAVADDKTVSLGKFLVGADGAMRKLDGSAQGAFDVSLSPSRISAIFLTQELPDDQDTKPSRQEFLRGAVQSERATLSTPLAGDAWLQEKGVYILDNPYTWKDGADYNGIWFGYYDKKKKSYQTGLSLKDAPDGWMYAGWVILKGVPLRVGKFRSALDNDDWGVYSGRTGASELIDPVGRPMPGEDFFTHLPAGVETGWNKPNLGGAKVVVSLESATLAQEDQYPGPVRILEATVPENPVHMEVYAFANVVKDQVPSGSAIVR